MVIKVALGRSNHLRDNGFDIEEEGRLYDESLIDVLMFSRWYLDNLEFLSTYRVSWHNYRGKGAVIPRRYVKETRTSREGEK